MQHWESGSGDTLTTLADLDDVSVGNRRPPGGESLVIRGRATAGVWIEAEFFALDSEARGAITVTVYPDRVLATIRVIRLFATSEPQVLPGDGPLIALVSGYQSWSACGVTPLPADATSFGAIGLTRAGHGIAAVWDPGEAGEGKVKLAADGSLDAVSEWQPARPVRSDGDSATLRIAYVPSGDGLAALHAAATPASSVDRERVAALTVPTGWCSWYELGPGVTEGDMLANVDFCAAHFDRRFLRYIQLDDGYQRPPAIGTRTRSSRTAIAASPIGSTRPVFRRGSGSRRLRWRSGRTWPGRIQRGFSKARSRLVCDVRFGASALETHPGTGEAYTVHHVALSEEAHHEDRESHQDGGCHLIRRVARVGRVEVC